MTIQEKSNRRKQVAMKRRHEIGITVNTLLDIQVTMSVIGFSGKLVTDHSIK